jgi:hypothetical protein
MDINTARKKNMTCPTPVSIVEKVRHCAKDCKCRFNIWYMLAKEKEEWLWNLALEVDKEEIEKNEELESKSTLGL